MIETDLIQRIARLARLGLPAREIEALGSELTAILKHFEAIQDVPTEGIEPLTHVFADHGQPQADVVRPFADARALLVGLSQDPREGFFVVPKVLEGPEAPAAPADEGG